MNDKIKLALVDPNPFILEGFNHLLNNSNQIEVCYRNQSAQKLLDTMGELCPDVIIADLKSIDLDIVELQKELNRDHPNAKLIGNASFNPGPLVKGLLRDGICSFFVKNEIDEPALINLIQCVHEFSFCYSSVITFEMIMKTWLSNESYPLPDFSEREETVLRMLCQGRNKSEIAAKMFISEHTVKYYIVNIFDKTQSQTVVELIVKARNSQWIETIELRRRVNRA